MTQLYELNELARCLGNGGIRQALADMAAQRIVERIWARDHTVWKPVDVEISNRLGWLRIAGEMVHHVERLTAFVRQLQGEGYMQAVLLGMGGSSLAPELFRKTFGVRPGFLDLAVLDSTDPGAVLSVAEGLDLHRTLFIVSTKSGGTVETLSFFKYFYNRVADAVGTEHAGAHFVAVTDPGASLADLAARYHFRETFLNDPTIGGRYSALSYFGLVAAALISMDLPLLLERGMQMGRSCGPEVPAQSNPAAQLGVVMAEAARAGRDKLTFVLSPSLTSFGDWVEQLIAESTGKEGKGILPVVGEPLGAPSLYASHDRLFVQLRLEGQAADDAALEELERENQPVVQLGLRDLYDVGAQIFLWEMATAVAGHRLGINPFDQPNVEAAKKQARQVMADYRAHGALPTEAPTLVRDGIAVYAAAPAGGLAGHTPAAALDDFLAQARPGDYVALHAYVQPTLATDTALQALRLRLRDRLHLATTLGYGPRFLHSTGQLHKGDANRGLFIQITADSRRDVPIPDEAGRPESSITFGVLKMAQALGDRRALQEAGRRVIRFHLDDVVDGLDHLTRSV
jgi:transaldolase/glucose-6-phosphate isomerase